MFNVRTLAIALSTATGFTLAASLPALSATFQYITRTNKAIYTEDATTVAGSAYDGTFTNTVFNPFSQREQAFSGFYKVQRGELGKAVSLSAVQQSPTNRTGLGSDGITRIEYLSVPQLVTTVPNGFTVPPGLTEFDFKFVPAAVAGAPVVLSNGWVAKPVAEPGIAFALIGVGLLGIGFCAKRSSADFQASSSR